MTIIPPLTSSEFLNFFHKFLLTILPQNAPKPTKLCIYNIRIHWIYSPPSNSHHHDSFFCSRESLYMKTFLCRCSWARGSSKYACIYTPFLQQKTPSSPPTQSIKTAQQVACCFFCAFPFSFFKSPGPERGWVSLQLKGVDLLRPLESASRGGCRVDASRSPRAAEASQLPGAVCALVGETAALGGWDPKKAWKFKSKKVEAGGLPVGWGGRNGGG